MPVEVEITARPFSRPTATETGEGEGDGGSSCRRLLLPVREGGSGAHSLPSTYLVRFAAVSKQGMIGVFFCAVLLSTERYVRCCTFAGLFLSIFGVETSRPVLCVRAKWALTPVQDTPLSRGSHMLLFAKLFCSERRKLSVTHIMCVYRVYCCTEGPVPLSPVVHIRSIFGYRSPTCTYTLCTQVDCCSLYRCMNSENRIQLLYAALQYGKWG